MRDHFAVGFGRKLFTARQTLFFQLGGILDNAVMYDGDLPEHMRMSVARRGRAVRCPTRVPDPNVAIYVLSVAQTFHPSLFLNKAVAAFIKRGDPRRIITAVL